MSCETNNRPRTESMKKSTNFNVDAALAAEAAQNLCGKHKAQEDKGKPDPNKLFGSFDFLATPIIDGRKIPPPIIAGTQNNSVPIPLVPSARIPPQNNMNIQVVPGTVGKTKFENQNPEDGEVRIGTTN